MTAVSVLVTTSNPGSALPGLVRSIDAQTLPAAEFELVVVDASDDGSADRLRQLGGRRPNVTVLAAGPDATEADRLALAFDRATGEYVLVLGQHRRLAPRALELLLDQARRTAADVVLGRVVTGAASGCTVLPDDADRLDVSGVDLSGCIAAVRRSSAAAGADVSAAASAAAGAVSAVGRYACAIQDGSPAAAPEDVSLDEPSYRWGEGMLHLTVGLRLPGPASPAVRGWLVATHGLGEVALPATIEPNEGDPSAVAVSATLDPRTAEGGHPLDDGPWDLLLRLSWPGREVTVPLGRCSSRSAVIAGRPYVLHAAGQAVRLDAGASRTSAVGPVPTSRTSIVESSNGTLVTFDYPTLHVHGDAVLDARLLLDGFGMPGRLVCENGSARLEAYVGSLAGTPEVSVQAGGGKPVPTGLRLRVDGTGEMTFEPVPPLKPKPPAAPASGDARLVQRLRRRVPGGLDPVVHRLARVPVLRRAYRRLISR